MIKVLFLAANPLDMDQRQLEAECRAIDAALRTGEHRDRFQFRSHWAVRTSDIQGIMLREKPHILHFSGHGSTLNEIQLVDEDGNAQPVSAMALGKLFAALQDNLRCVVLSGGYTAEQGESIAEHVDCVVGMSKQIDDASVTEFAEAFYRALGYGRDIQTAFDLGRNQLELDNLAEVDAPRLFATRADAATVTLVTGVGAEVALAQEFSVPPREVERNERIFVPPNVYDPASDRLPAEKVIWIVGPPGIGKQTLALAIARQRLTEMIQQGRPLTLHSIPRHIEWSQLDQSDVRDAVLILPDTLGAISFDREQLDGDLACLERLVKRGNLVIATSPDDIYGQAKMRTRRFAEWLAANAHTITLLPQVYSDHARQLMFERLLEYAYATGALSAAQQRLASDILSGATQAATSRPAAGDLIGQAHGLLMKFLREIWIPVDIDRFVFTSLPAARVAREIVGVLQQGSDIDTRVHVWFGALVPTTQSFVFTLALFAGLDDRSLWFKYKDVVQLLKPLNPGLAVLPLGILRQHAAPYVTTTGRIDFSNSSVYRAIIHEISQSYREYFVELRDQLTEWSVAEKPPARTARPLSSTPVEGSRPAEATAAQETDEDTDFAAETESLRNAVARVVGEIAKQSLEDVLPILRAWGSHKAAIVGRTVGLALSDAASDPSGSEPALSLLHAWATGFSDGTSRYRRRSAAAAFGQIAMISTRPDLQSYALEELQLLAMDRDSYIRTEVAYAVSRLAGSLPLSQFRQILSKLVRAEYDRKVDRSWAYRDIARALDRATPREGVPRLIEGWLSSERATARRAAGYMLLGCSNLEDGVRRQLLRRSAEEHPTDFVRAVLLATAEDNIPMAWHVLRTFISGGPRGSRALFIEAVAVAAADRQLPIEPLRAASLEKLSGAGVAAVWFEIDTLTGYRTIGKLGRTDRAAAVTRLAELHAADASLALAVLTRLAHADAEADHPLLTDILADGAPDVPESFQIVLAALLQTTEDSLTTVARQVHDRIYERTIQAWTAYLQDLIPREPERVLPELLRLFGAPGEEQWLDPAAGEANRRFVQPDAYPALAAAIAAHLGEPLVDVLAHGAACDPGAYLFFIEGVAVAEDPAIQALLDQVDILLFERAVDAWTTYVYGLVERRPVDVLPQLAQLLDRLVVVSRVPGLDAELLGQLVPEDRYVELAAAVLSRLMQAGRQGINEELADAMADGATASPGVFIDLLAAVEPLIGADQIALLRQQVERVLYARSLRECTDYIKDVVAHDRSQTLNVLTDLLRAHEEDSALSVNAAALCAVAMAHACPPLAQRVLSDLAQASPRGIHDDLLEALADGATADPQLYGAFSARLVSFGDNVVSHLPEEVSVILYNRSVDRNLAFLDDFSVELSDFVKSLFKKTYTRAS